jgi:hypothetical protein
MIEHWGDAGIIVGLAAGAWLIYFRMRRTTLVLVAAIVTSIAAAGMLVAAILR